MAGKMRERSKSEGPPRERPSLCQPGGFRREFIARKDSIENAEGNSRTFSGSAWLADSGCLLIPLLFVPSVSRYTDAPSRFRIMSITPPELLVSLKQWPPYYDNIMIHECHRCRETLVTPDYGAVDEITNSEPAT